MSYFVALREWRVISLWTIKPRVLKHMLSSARGSPIRALASGRYERLLKPVKQEA
jgi:hypothetical protein